MDPRNPENSPLPPPAGTAAYDEYLTTHPEPDEGGGGAPKRAAIVAVLGAIIGLVAGLAIGFGVWHGSGTTQASAGTGSNTPAAANGQPFTRNGYGFAGGSGTGSGTARPGGGAPFAAGTVSSVSGNTIEVTNPNGGTTKVTISGDTKIEKSTTGSTSDVTNGVCVTARGTTQSDGTVAATNVSISQPTNGECAAGFRGGFGGNGVPPQGAPGAPSDASGTASN
jgi:hypothetical protein